MAIGVDYNVFWSLNPRLLKPFVKAYELKRKMEDEKMWMMGMYVENAVFVAVEHNLAGRKAKNKYMEKPLLQDIKSDNSEKPKEMSHEEKMQKVNAIFASLNARKANWDLQKKLKEQGN